MQASFSMSSALPLCRIAAGAVLLSALAACGYKGPLYMPPPPPPDAALTKPPTSATLPATNPAEQSAASDNAAKPTAVQ